MADTDSTTDEFNAAISMFTSLTPSPELAHDFTPLIKVYKDGRVERITGNDAAPPSFDPKTDVDSKDVVVSNNLSVRIYLPNPNPNPNQFQTHNNTNAKLPVLVYIHGGGFCIESAFSPFYHSYLNALVSESNVIAVSVNYRRAPEHPLPMAFDDSWDAFKWVASHVNSNGPEDWLNRCADLKRVFVAGDSAGATIAHHIGIRMSNYNDIERHRFNIVGIILVHPFFWGVDPVGGETTDAKERWWFEGIWRLACPETSGPDDPLINPWADSSGRMMNLGCERVLVFVAEKDKLCPRGRVYCEKLKESGWRGHVEIDETKGEGHVFHLFRPNCKNASSMLKKTAAFLNHQDRA